MVRSVPGAWRAQGLDQAKMPQNCRRFGLVEFRKGTGTSGQGRGLRLPTSPLKPSFKLSFPGGSLSHGSPGAAVPVLQGHLPHLPGAPAALPGALTSSWLRPSWILGAVHRASLCQASRPGSAPAASGIWGWALTWPGCWLRGGAGNNFSCATRRACQRLTLFFTKRRTFIS